jgi:hypothetical protein
MAGAEMNDRLPTERSFGISVGLVLAAIGALSWWRGHEMAATLLGAMGGLLLMGGLFAPAVLRVPNRVWWRLAGVLGRINARILLTLFFFLVITPVGAVMRLLGRNPLQPLRTDTNWTTYPDRYRNSNHYERLF